MQKKRINNKLARCRIGFTLVELLVVITIISILAGMLIPALSKAVDSARETACRGNAGQLGHAFSFYLDENRARLPNAGAHLTANDACWCNAVDEYVNRDVNVFLCPIAPKWSTPLHQVSNGHSYGKPSYGMNTYLYIRPPLSRPGAGAWTLDADGNPIYIRFSIIRAPSQCVLLGQSANPLPPAVNNAQYLSPTDGYSPSAWYGKLDYRHRGGATYLWADTHVGWKHMQSALDHAKEWFGPEQR